MTSPSEGSPAYLEITENGTTTRYSTHTWKPHNFAFCCPHCGTLWARAHCGYVERWVFLSLPCSQCPEKPDHPAGSIWIGWEPLYQRALSLSLLEREFYIHANSPLLGAK